MRIRLCEPNAAVNGAGAVMLRVTVRLALLAQLLEVPANQPAAPQAGWPCAVVAAYFMLHLNGVPVSYDRVVTEFGGQNGSIKLAEFTAALARLGLPCRVRIVESRPPRLQSAAVVLVLPPGQRLGHYFVVRPVGFEGTGLQVFDPPAPTRIIEQQMFWKKLENCSVAVVEPQGWWEQPAYWQWVGAGLGAAGIVLLVWRMLGERPKMCLSETKPAAANATVEDGG
jgi:hypothetical protein